MDREVIIWLLVFFGGYGLVLGWLLKIALSKKPG
jgi:hypothetical protein